MTKEIVLACDLGGTNLRMAAVDVEGTILFREKAETPKGKKAEDVVRSIVKTAEICRAAAEHFGRITALAIAAPATINSKEGITLKAPNVPALSGFHLAQAVSDALDLPVILENDANAAAVGEHSFGAARGCLNAVVVTLGTGVGGGIIINGNILQGIDGTAGEIGHICVEPLGATCGCGAQGCVEQYASATAIVRLVGDLGDQYPESALHNKTQLTSADVYAAGIGGDKLALEVFRQMGCYLGIALAGLVNVLNPEVIVIGGGASAGWDLFARHTQEEIRKRSFREPAERVQLVRALLGDDAGILGAARLAFER